MDQLIERGVLAQLSASDHLLDENEVARLLSWEVATLRRRRWEGKPPGFLKIGSSVRYDPKELIEFVETSRRRSTSGMDRELERT